MERRESIKLMFHSVVFASLGVPLVRCKASNDPLYQYQVLSENELLVLTEIATLMIPSTDDSPGANTLNLLPSIDDYIANFYAVKVKNEIKIGLQNIDKLSINQYGKAFHSCRKSEQDALMNLLANDANKAANPSLHLFFVLRSLIISAYFNHPEIRTKVLAYDPTPGKYLGCISIDEHTRSWSL